MTGFEQRQSVIYIGRGVKVTGVAVAEEAIVIDGVLSGDIACKQTVIGVSGVVSGRMTVSDADIYGKVNADIVAKQSLIARASATIEGNWSWGAIVAERGAILRGTSSDAATILNRTDAMVGAPPRAEA